MAAAFAALALVSWDRSPMGPWKPPSIVSLCSVGPLPESRCLSTCETQLVLNQTVQQPRCQHCFTNFAGVVVNLAVACLTAARCIWIRAISCSSWSTATSSAAVCVFCCARTLVCRICNAARMLQESILSEARIVSAFGVVLCCRFCVPSPRARLQQLQPGGTLNHVVWSIGDGNACDVATAS